MNRSLRAVISVIFATMALVSSCGILPHRPSPGPDLHGYEPLGRLETVTYPTSVPGPSFRKMMVYLPQGYDTDSTSRYPVVYLLHGARGSETTWVWQGNAVQRADSLYSRGLATPAIIVMPDVNFFRNDKDYDHSRFKSAVECLLEVNGAVETGFGRDVVGFIDSHFRTWADKEHRAIAGMSIGGMQAAFLSANYPDLFDYVALFSPIASTILRYSRYNKFYLDSFRKLRAQFRDDPPRKYFIMRGRFDLLVSPQTDRMHYDFNLRGFTHFYYVTHASGHSWECWRESLDIFLSECFR